MSGSLRRDVTLCVCVDVCTLGCGLDHAHLACSTLQRGPEHVLNCYGGFDCSANPQVTSTLKCVSTVPGCCYSHAFNYVW